MNKKVLRFLSRHMYKGVLLALVCALVSCVSLTTAAVDAVAGVAGLSPEELEFERQSFEPGNSFTRLSEVVTAMSENKRLMDFVNGMGEKLGINLIEGDPLAMSNRADRITLRVPGGQVVCYVVYPHGWTEDKEYSGIFYCHGGGFNLQGIGQFKLLLCSLADKTNSVVFFPEYRLAPEFRFPAGWNDCWATWRWLGEENRCWGYGIDPKNLFLMGDSAGGSFAAGISIRSAELGLNQPAGVVLLYPSVDATDRLNGSRLLFSGVDGFWNITSIKYLQWVLNDYLDTPDDAYKPYASPLLMTMGLINHRGWDNVYKPYAAKIADPTVLAPTFVGTAGIDTLRDEGKMYAFTLKALGVETEFHEYKGLFHAWAMSAMALNKATKGLNDAVSFIERHKK